MNKIEFSDVNRFLTSLGLIFIGFAFFLPWFINQNNSLLTIEQDKIDNLTPTARQIIVKQQNLLLIINRLIPYVSIALIIIGVTILVIGIIKWKKRQAVLDRIQDEELKSKEIQNMSSQDKRNLIESELEDSSDINQKNDPEEIEQNINEYINIENRIFLQLSEIYKGSYALSQNIKIGDHYYDIILKSKDINAKSDKVIEIKFFKNNLNYETLEEIATKLIVSAKHYEISFKRKTFPYLIIIYFGNEFDGSLKEYKRNLQVYSKTLGKVLYINFFGKKQLETINPIEYLKTI